MNSVASTTAPVRVPARPTSAKKARSATVVRATQDSKSKAAPVEEESGFWRKVFLPNGKEEVKSEDYQKFHGFRKRAATQVGRWIEANTKMGDPSFDRDTSHHSQKHNFPRWCDVKATQNNLE